ncbi:hypothetical protein, partial [Actinomadura sp. CNU-125]|uniref:hypothetical protein n=1 Tax=Actinomadura sp. CNU-125 TaxID=1904961 RepID=UPI0021CCEABB
MPVAGAVPPPRRGRAGRAGRGLGGAAPYVELRTPRPVRDPAPAGARVYAATGPGMLAPAARDLPRRLYVATGRYLDVIDPLRLRVVDRLPAGGAARVVPSWDMRRLWAADTRRGALVPRGPRRARTGGAGARSREPVLHPGRRAGARPVPPPPPRRVRDPRTMRPRAAIPMPCTPGTPTSR